MKTSIMLVSALAVSLGVIAVTAPSAFLKPARKSATNSPPKPPSPDSSRSALVDASHPIPPIPHQAVLDERVVALGRRLFQDARLSSDGTISCASCHDLATGGDDGRRVSFGVGGAHGELNAPTVLNSSLNFRQFWDGRAKTLEDQAGGPVSNPKEMGSTWPDVLRKLGEDPEYARDFALRYPDGISEANVKNAIATFERSLITPDSRFDRYLNGDASAITADELRGYELFKDVGCVTCHQGVNIGGNLFQRLGIASNLFEDRGELRESDLGRFNLTGRESDRFKFKVPSLRNITKTAPYLHDGSAATLDQVVRIMAHYQLGMSLPDEDVSSIAAFLGALDGIQGN